MGVRNYLIDGHSGTGKTAVAEVLARRGYHVVHGDRVLAYFGDPVRGGVVAEPVHASEAAKARWQHDHWCWDVSKVNAAIADQAWPVTFFCGGARNASRFIDRLDGVFILEVSDLATLFRRMDERVARDPTDWGGKVEEKELLARLHGAGQGVLAEGMRIDATQPLMRVVEEIVSRSDRA